MKFISKKNSKSNLTGIQSPRDNLIQRFDQANLKLQYKCAHWLEQKTAHFSRTKWIVHLLCFTILTGFFSIYLIVNGLSGSRRENITIISIVKPRNPISFESKSTNLKNEINETEFKKLLQVQNYLDSLGRSPTGEKRNERILKYSPELLDSILLTKD